MESTNRGILPNRRALEKIVEAFANKGIRVHFDVGDLFDRSPGSRPSNYDLSDGDHQVPWLSNVDFNNVYQYKEDHLPLHRNQIFYYTLFANSQGRGVGGTAEVRGNNMLMTLGETFSSSAPDIVVVNIQASVLMHELGHNLGLLHGGNVRENHKPNYYSILNYLYTTGLPPAGSAGDRYYRSIGYGDITARSLANGPYSESFKIDYSDGSGPDLHEANLQESEGIGRGLGAIDWNTNALSNERGITHDINPQDATNLNVLRDYDDWGNLYFIFYHSANTAATWQLSIPNAFIFNKHSKSAEQSRSWSGPCWCPLRH